MFGEIQEKVWILEKRGVKGAGRVIALLFPKFPSNNAFSRPGLRSEFVLLPDSRE